MAQERDKLEKIEDDREDIAFSEEENLEYQAESDIEGTDEMDLVEETDLIKEQIVETRSQMGETIDAIQEKLSFSNLSEQVTDHVNHAVETAKDAVYEATIGKAANIMKNISDELSTSSIVKTAKDNPLPFILIGVGAGLLIYKNLSGNGGNARRQLTSGRRVRDDDGGRDLPSGERVRGTVDGITGTVSNAAGTAYDKVSSTVGSAVHGVGDAASQAYGKVGQAGTVAREQYEYYIEENPLAVGAVALALGAAVGMAIPSTRYEGQLMGQARQDLFEKAQETATGLLDKSKQVVTEAGQSVAEQAKAALAE